jgi:hypothetical protein
MNKLTARLLFIVFTLACLSASAYTERNILQHKITKTALKEALVADQSWVPYPSYADRSGWNKLFGESRDACIQRGEKYLNYQWKVIKATDYIEYDKSGNRRIMEDPNSQNNSAISSLMMAELAEGKGRFIPQLINGVFQACERTSWALSAHLGGSQASKRALPDYDDMLMDLGSGEEGAMLSWIYYFFHQEFDKVTPQISKRLKYEIERRQMLPFMNNLYWWMALDYKEGNMVNNWNPWCNFNVLQSYMLIENDKDKLADAVYRTLQSVDKFLNYIHMDGACEEGPAYWGHASGKLFDYLQLLYMGTQHKVSLFDMPALKSMGEYIVRSYVGNGWMVNFADSHSRLDYDPFIIYRFGKYVNSTLMTSFAAYLNQRNTKKESDGKFLSTGTDVYQMLQALFYKEELSKTTPSFVQPRYTWYPETQFCYMTNDSGLFLAAKGGNNNESHNHNDVGTFSVYSNTIPILIDAGVGTYTRQTFGKDRYKIWSMQSNYHNLPLINGVPEAFGGNYKAKGTMFDANKMLFSTDIANAYPADAQVNSWKRTCMMKKNSIIVVDKYNLKSASKLNEINFMTWGNADISKPGIIRISAQNEGMILSYEKDKFSPRVECIPLTDPSFTKIWGKQIYRVTLTAKVMNTEGMYTYIIQKE